MRQRKHRLALVLASVAFVSAVPISLGITHARINHDRDLVVALETVLDDERHAEALYEAVMARFGDRPPFSRIVDAERRHSRALIAQFERLGIDVPENRWGEHVFEIPELFEEVCDRAVVAEIRNAALYDKLLESVDDETVKSVFRRLADASIQRHLPAFKRHSSGWETVGELTDQQEQQRTAAIAARDAMFQALMTELSQAMHKGGPSHAIKVCAERAPQIASETGTAHGVAIGRTSDKLRNSGNLPPVWADLLLDERPTSERVLSDRAGRLGIVTPIRAAGACLQCHGNDEEVLPETRRALSERYPHDRAMGYSDGDLRGWFWVEVKPLD